MEDIKTVFFIAASIAILFGYLRFITDEKGNIDLNHYRFTGGLSLVFGGMVEGTRDLIARNISTNGLSALAIYCGVIGFYIGIKL